MATYQHSFTPDTVRTCLHDSPCVSPGVYQRPYRMGILIYNGLKSAHSVPVFVREISASTNFGVVDSSMAIDTWIAPSASGPDIMWTKVMKMTDRHALFYYSAKTCKSHMDLPLDRVHICMEDAVGDVLFLKLQGEQVVDIDDNDLVEVLTRLDRIL